VRCSDSLEEKFSSYWAHNSNFPDMPKRWDIGGVTWRPISATGKMFSWGHPEGTCFSLKDPMKQAMGLLLLSVLGDEANPERWKRQCAYYLWCTGS
jgi:hypothetical protein